MSKKDWLWMAIVGGAGAGLTFLARWVYKRFKEGKFKKFLTEEERQDLMEAIKDFLEEKK